MTKFNSKHKTKAFLGAAFMLLIAFIFTACPQKAKPKHTITFSVDGAGGTLKAKVEGGSEINSGNTIEHGKTVTFTAKANDGYKVKGWTLDGNAVNGTAETYTLTVTQPATVTVSFELKKALLTLEAGKNTVKVKAKTADGKPITVEGCTVTELASEVETTLTVTATDNKLALVGELTELNCRGSDDASNRPLVALDVSGCTALQKLDCANNHLTALNVHGLTTLQELNCGGNQLPELNVQGCTSLKVLNCQYNEIAELDVSRLTALQELQCNDTNQLETLNVQGCTSLKVLNCRYNKIADLDVSGLTALQELDCETNQLTTLNVQGLTALQTLNCSGNKLSELNMQGCTSLQRLDCYSNQLAALDMQGCTSLKLLRCDQNKLNADVFTKLLNDLPTRNASDDAKAILYTEDKGLTENNCKDFTQPEDLKKAFEGAKAKCWKLQKMKRFGRTEDI